MPHQLVDVRNTLTRHPTKFWGPRFTPIDLFCIHHSATSPTVTPEQMARYHVNEKDMPSIQYHYVIAADGTVYWCNDDNLFVYHGHDFNTGLGICLTGDFSSGEPTNSQIEAARWLYAQKQREHGALPLVGHFEAPRANTECPGLTWSNWRERLIPHAPEVIVHRNSKLCPFYQKNPERGHPSTEVITHSRVPAVRALHIEDMPENPFPNKEVHSRLWTRGDEGEFDLMCQGREGAEKYFSECLPKYTRLKAMGIYHVSGGNEPLPRDLEQLQAANEFQLRLAELLGTYGMHYWAWDWSVGWPDYGLAQYWVESVRVARQTGGGLCVHAYGAPSVFNNTEYTDDHYALRVYNQINELYSAGLERGENWVIIGEDGIDGGVIDWGKDPRFPGPSRRGWREWADWVYPEEHGLPQGIMNEERYWKQLSAKDDVYLTIPEVRWSFPFVAHPRHDWADFVINQYILDNMAHKHSTDPFPLPGEDLQNIIGEVMQAHVIPLNPEAALYKAAREFSAHLVPASDEVYDVDGFVAQVFRDPLEDHLQRIFYTRVGEWGLDQIKTFTREN